MTEFRNDNERSGYGHPPVHFNREDDLALLAGDLQLSMEAAGTVDSNGNMTFGQRSSLDDGSGITAAPAPDTVKSAPGSPIRASSLTVGESCLEDYKCPICLDTFINTVKVDCSYGHKFCNFCIQCWINFERHLVTECPVCRGPIFGKSLDLKTDAEIRAIYDSLSEEEKRARLLSIKERLQMEYPNSYSNIQQHSTGFPIPMRFSDAPHHSFNHDLHIPIPLVGVMEGGAMQFRANHPQESDFYQNYGESVPQQVWPQGVFYPSTWSGSYSPEFQSVHNINLQQPYLNHNQNVDPPNPNPDVHHQHYHHQNHENSRWDNNLYLTQEDTASSPSSGRIFAVSGTSHPHLLDQVDTGRQNQLHDAPSMAHSYQTAIGMPHHQNSPMLNYSGPMTPQNVYHMDPYPVTYLPRSPVTQVTMQPNHLNGFYCCYLPTCPSHHCPGPVTHQFATSSMPQTANSHHSVNESFGQRQMSCPNINGSVSGSVAIDPNSCNTISGNMAAMSHGSPPRIRPNMPGATSTSIQLPSPTRLRPRQPVSSYHRASAPTNNSSAHAQPRIRQPVSRCPARNNRAQFSGGFSLFSSGYMRFQISHVPTTMVVGDRYVSTPPAHLTHPLVSLIPLNQDGSSARVSLTFEVHRV